MSLINFYCEEIEFSLPKKDKTVRWIRSVIKAHGYSLESLTFIFCTDQYLHQINLQFLNHDTLTDIITFDNSEKRTKLSGDIYISIDRVTENARTLGTPFNEELHRVMIHGVLHLLGFKDKTKKEKREMRTKEDLYLSLPTVPRETF
jgi:probable rRNA maturation factor